MVRTGIVTERLLTDYLRSVGVRFKQSKTLDEVHKIDALITGIKGFQGKHRPIGLQITQMRGNRRKIWAFMRNAINGTNGPILYAEIVGRTTRQTAQSIKEACIEIWTSNQFKRKKTFGIIVDPKGTRIWFNPRKTPRPRNK